MPCLSTTERKTSPVVKRRPIVPARAGRPPERRGRFHSHRRSLRSIRPSGLLPGSNASQRMIGGICRPGARRGPSSALHIRPSVTGRERPTTDGSRYGPSNPQPNSGLSRHAVRTSRVGASLRNSSTNSRTNRSASGCGFHWNCSNGLSAAGGPCGLCGLRGHGASLREDYRFRSGKCARETFHDPGGS